MSTYKGNADEWLLSNLCPKCRSHYDVHRFLSNAKIKEIEDEGGTVKICDMHIGILQGALSWEEGIPRKKGMHWVKVVIPACNPCDSDFMENISS